MEVDRAIGLRSTKRTKTGITDDVEGLERLRRELISALEDALAECKRNQDERTKAEADIYHNESWGYRKAEAGVQPQRRVLAAKKNLSDVCARLQSVNDRVLGKLPGEVWESITCKLWDDDLFAFGMTCRFFREKQKDLCENSIHELCTDNEVLVESAEEGNLERLRWFRREGCPWKGPRRAVQKHECSAAAGGGHLEVLKWLRAQDPPCPWDESTCTAAAAGGHLEVLKFLRSQEPPCPWNMHTCTAAAEGGHLEVLKFLRSQERPCPWGDLGETTIAAAARGHLEALRWLRAQEPPCPFCNYGLTCEAAATNGHLDVLKWLRSIDPPCPWNEASCEYYTHIAGQQHVVDWIHEVGTLHWKENNS